MWPIGASAFSCTLESLWGCYNKFPMLTDFHSYIIFPKKGSSTNVIIAVTTAGAFYHQIKESNYILWVNIFIEKSKLHILNFINNYFIPWPWYNTRFTNVFLFCSLVHNNPQLTTTWHIPRKYKAYTKFIHMLLMLLYFCQKLSHN